MQHFSLASLQELCDKPAVPYRQQYGLNWDESVSPLEVEFKFIRRGGYIERNGIRYGKGRFHHYKAAQSLLWPEDDHHRWSDLMLRRKCEHDILVMMGSSDSNKTYSTARYVLTDYWAHCENTLWITSTTELRGAELRIWGKLKELFNRARALHPWLAGRILENKLCITTEEISQDGSEGRLLTKGIIFIPCKRAENWVGLGAYAGIKPTKNGRLGHAGDEVSFMERSFLQAYANWVGKESFQGILDGNPTDHEDPLCTAAEPVEGWQEWEDTGKTQEWLSKWYSAWVIAFDGRDSPNFDPPVGPRPRFPYLIGPKKIKAVGDTEGTDSPLFWMQCVGKPLPGASLLKVITRQDCENGGAFQPVIWEGTHIEDVVGLDAAYGGVGGDRCVLQHTRFGKDIEGGWVVCCKPPIQVPVSVKNPEDPETQIARFCKKYCEGFRIVPAHFFFDARATLAVKLANIWSSEVNVVDFGGLATDRPVSENEYIWDGDLRTKRLKKCSEHYSKFVTELWFSVRYLITGKQLRELPRQTAEEGYRRLWHYTKGTPPRIEVETKKEMKERVQFSPDFFDALVIAVEGARRLGFRIKNLREATSLEADNNWLEDAVAKERRFRQKHELKLS